MSVVVAVRDPGGASVHLAADGAAIDVDHDLVTTGQKLVAITGQQRVVVGATGWSGWLDLLVEAIAAEPMPPTGEPLGRWVHRLARAATSAGVEAGFVDEAGRLDCSALLAIGGHCWEISHHVAFPVGADFAATGSGAAVAIGALHELHRVSIGDPQAWAELAVEAAIAHVSSVAGPISAAST